MPDIYIVFKTRQSKHKQPRKMWNIMLWSRDFFSHQQPNRPIIYGFIERVTVSQHGLAILCD